MIVKIFKPRGSFKAVSYNISKILAGGGEMMKVRGFDALSMLPEVRAEDYVNYLKALSALNGNVRKPQFHAMISAPDERCDKRKLTRLAQQWLKAMGYGDQPCLLVFHKDTDQAHVHMVTTRVARDGRKIDSAFEGRRAVTELNRLLQLDEAHQAQLDAGKALSYSCSTKAQVLLLLEGMGYMVREKDKQLILHKYGKALFAIRQERLEQKLSNYLPDEKRAVQLKAIFCKYQVQFDPGLQRRTVNLAGGRTRETAGFRSNLSDFLNEKFGIQLVFHASGEQPPYGYTVIDHGQQRVFKGSEIMRLKELISSDLTTPTITVQPENDAETDLTHGTENQPLFRPYLSDDVDDQQIHGMRRRRQKKSRTNTR